MKKIATAVFIILMITSCKLNTSSVKGEQENVLQFTEIIKPDYELYKPDKEVKTVLILFGGYPEVAKDIKREFKILDAAISNNVAVVFSNFNQKLWIQKDEKYALAEKLQDIIIENELPNDNVFIGGFSSGGIISLLISDFIIGMKQFDIDPRGVFIVDSPVDLAELYQTAEKNIESNFSETSVQESQWLIKTLENEFGNPETEIATYEKQSVYTLRTNNIDNLRKLKNTKIRLYTEPDTAWWKQHRMAGYEQLNAFQIKNLAEDLKIQGFEDVEYISTINRGYRANGERHPHSWAIVDEMDLIHWMVED